LALIASSVANSVSVSTPLRTFSITCAIESLLGHLRVDAGEWTPGRLAAGSRAVNAAIRC
jgi:hypothetical protein